MKQQPATGVPLGYQQGTAPPPYLPPPTGGPPPPYQGPPQPHQAAAKGYQHYPQTLGIPAQGQWSTGLCDCFDDVPNCCLTCWCPCITFGQNAEIIDKGSSSCGVSGGLYALIAVFTGCQFIYSCTYRTKLKQQYDMPQGALEDCCIHFWCHGCAICQEYRELQHRGFEVSLGWHGNVERMNRAMGVTNPPVAPAGMTR